jgi:hypothetical protein
MVEVVAAAAAAMMIVVLLVAMVVVVLLVRYCSVMAQVEIAAAVEAEAVDYALDVMYWPCCFHGELCPIVVEAEEEEHVGEVEVVEAVV